MASKPCLSSTPVELQAQAIYLALHKDAGIQAHVHMFPKQASALIHLPSSQPLNPLCCRNSEDVCGHGLGRECLAGK